MHAKSKSALFGWAFMAAGLCADAQNTTFYSVQDGPWHNVATWTNPAHYSRYPSTGDYAQVNHSILVTGSVAVANCSVNGGALSIDTGASLTALEGTGIWQNARLGGGGSFLNQAHMIFTSTAPSEISGRFLNQGEVTFVQTPSFRLDGLFHNDTQGVTTVGASRTNLFTMQGTGSFHNAGTFSVHQGTTSAWPQVSLHNWGGSVAIHSAGVVSVESSFGTNYGGNYQLDTDALYHMRTGTNWFGGTTTVQGAGAMVLQSGQAIFYGHAGSTSAALNAQGGGFLWQGGTLWATTSLVNQGTVIIGGQAGATQFLQGAFYNASSVHVVGAVGALFNMDMARMANWPTAWFGFSGTNPLAIGYPAGSFKNEGALHVSSSGTATLHVADFSMDGGALTIDTGAMLASLGGTGTWQNARLGGGGSFLNQAHMIFTSTAPSEISGRFLNQGEVTFVQTPSFRLDGLFHNDTQGVTTVGASRTNLFTMQGTGSFHNAGTFSVHQGTTSAWPQVSLHNWGGSVAVHSAGVVCVESSFGTNYGGNYQLDTDALYHMRTGTNWFGGTTTVQGAGAMVLQSGQAVFFGSTSAVLNAQGGGFHWLGGGVSSTQALVNYGTMLIGGPGAWTQALQGVLYNSGEVTVRGETASVLRVTGVISNLPSGRITMGGTNPAIVGQGSAYFHNRGSVTFAGMGTSSVYVSFYHHGGTSVFQSGKTSLPIGQLFDGLLLMDGGTWGGNMSFIQSGGQLAGTGAITRALYHSGGIVSPGKSAGRLEIQDNYTQFGTNAALRMELAGAEPGASHDQLWISLTGRISGVLTVELLGGYDPPPAARFDVVRASPLQGLFTVTNLPALTGDRFWLLRYLPDAAQLRVATPEDTDGDGLPDEWELRFFDDLDGSDGGEVNSDDDSFTDEEEFIADTNPTNPASFFRILDVNQGPPVTVNFEPGSTGRVYTFQFSEELMGDLWTNVPGVAPRPGVGGPDAMIDTNEPPSGPFYRLEVGRP